MVLPDLLDGTSKARLLEIWKNMSESDKAHFINQVALALSVWGSDEKGKRLVVEIIRLMTQNGTSTLADFGLYIEQSLKLKESVNMADVIQRAMTIIEGYRIKNALASEPHKNIEL
jgi:hypothetical protein